MKNLKNKAYTLQHFNKWLKKKHQNIRLKPWEKEIFEILCKQEIGKSTFIQCLMEYDRDILLGLHI